MRVAKATNSVTWSRETPPWRGKLNSSDTIWLHLFFPQAPSFSSNVPIFHYNPHAYFLCSPLCSFHILLPLVLSCIFHILFIFPSFYFSFPAVPISPRFSLLMIRSFSFLSNPAGLTHNYSFFFLSHIFPVLYRLMENLAKYPNTELFNTLANTSFLVSKDITQANSLSENICYPSVWMKVILKPKNDVA